MLMVWHFVVSLTYVRLCSNKCWWFGILWFLWHMSDCVATNVCPPVLEKCWNRIYLLHAPRLSDQWPLFHHVYWVHPQYIVVFSSLCCWEVSVKRVKWMTVLYDRLANICEFLWCPLCTCFWKPAGVERCYMYCLAKCLCYIYCKTFGCSHTLCCYLVFSWKMLLKLETSMGKILMEMSMVHKKVCHDGIQFLLGMLWQLTL
jgi:hypothetical protein